MNFEIRFIFNKPTDLEKKESEDWSGQGYDALEISLHSQNVQADMKRIHALEEIAPSVSPCGLWVGET